MLGMRFGTPIPTLIRICYHPDAGHWLEFMDGTDADAVAQEYPDDVRRARVEMMQLAEQRGNITTTFRRKTQPPTPPPGKEPSTRIAKAAAPTDAGVKLPVAKPITLRIAKPASAMGLAARPTTLPKTVSVPPLDPLPPAKLAGTADLPPTSRQTPSEVFTINEQTKQRLAQLLAASRRNPPGNPTTDAND
jgi:hypothetical protein